MSTANAFGAPIPLSEIESVLAWVDTFKLSRATKKIHRDFADAVLLAEILAVHYPKLVEMHNYPPRNSHSLKLNNWMTLNRKVLKKLKLNLCCNTMEQLANSTPGVIERVLVMVRDKIKRDEELEKSSREAETNMSSGGSYYEACGEEDHVLVVPVKTRVNGVLETIQQKVVSYAAYVALKAELKDAQDTSDILKQKVEHLDSLIKLKDERITELQKQLERKQSRRGKEPEIIPNSLSVPFDEIPDLPNLDNTIIPVTNKSSGTYNLTNPSKTIEDNPDNTKIPTPKTSNTKQNLQEIAKSQSQELIKETVSKISKPIPNEPSITEVTSKDTEKINADQINIDQINTDQINTDLISDVERVKSDVFKEANVFEDKNAEGDELEFKDSEQGNIVTIEDTIQKELVGIRQA